LTGLGPFQGLHFERNEAQESPAVAGALAKEIAARFAPRQEQPFSILAREQDGSLAGGVNGASHWGWLYVRHLFVAEAWRGQGLGRQLMEEAESLARDRSCLGIYLDTFDPGAVAFYERLGYARFGAIPDFPLGHERSFLSKRLEGA
jgi:GNAT superfamily N-acetyltransferase